MQAVGRLGSYITRVSGPFHPFGGAVDIVVVEQQDGSFMSSPWYVRFGKFQGVLKTKQKAVNISVNGVEADFHMYLDHKGQAFFLREVDAETGGGESVITDQYPSSSSSSSSSGDDTDDNPSPRDNKRPFKSKTCNFDSVSVSISDRSSSVARTGSRRSRLLGLVFGRRSLKGDINNSLRGKVENADINRTDSLERAEIAANLLELKWSTNLPCDQLPRKDNNNNNNNNNKKFRKSSSLQVECVELEARIEKQSNGEEVSGGATTVDILDNSISEEGVSVGGFQSLVYCETSRSSIEAMDCAGEQTNEVLCLANGGCGRVHVHAEVVHATTVLLPQVAETEEVSENVDLGMPVMEVSELRSQQRDCSHSDVGVCDAEDVENQPKFTKSQTSSTDLRRRSVRKIRANTPTSEQLASLNLKEGRNTVTFIFYTAMLGKQQVDAQIYLWKWNTRIVISDVDGTITKSDVLGQFMPLVGIDWSQTGVAHLYSAIKENGYQLLFLSARAISQAYHTRQFLFNLKQDGKLLPDGPVVISPDGLFPSLYREVIKRTPHEFKIACLEDIRALFPSDCNPFYAGFGNRITDEISYLKAGIPKGKIFIINPRGEIAVNRLLDTKSYASLGALVNGMFPPMNSSEQEDFNSWNYWKLPPPVIDT